MRIAITGASGRVGQGVVPMALARGHSVLSIVHSSPAKQEEPVGLTSLQLEMTDYAAVEQALLGCDAVIHLAAIPAPRGHPDHLIHNNNVVSSYNVLSAAARLGITRVCMASSVNATGGVWSRQPRYDYFPLDESHPTYNEDAYSLSKWIGEQQADLFARRYSFMAIASLRLHAVTRERPVLPSDAVTRRAGDLWGYTSLEAAARGMSGCSERRYQRPRGVIHCGAQHGAGRAFAPVEGAFLSRGACTWRPCGQPRLLQL